MNTDDDRTFYNSLSELEQHYWHELHQVFQLVQPQKPGKGCKAIILRARRLALADQLPLEHCLQQQLEGATQRTHKRLALLNRCPLAQSSTLNP